ncbi:hypothetical protein CMT69_01500 [Elizabethkingia anophelis]|nr:hypothetical protein [Elizabethkingia anophelis]
METPKQLAIKAAYGELYIKHNPDENGWVQWNIKNDFGEENVESKVKGDKLIYRLKILRGIETNNSWTRIESEEDIPDNNELYNSGLLDNEGVFHHEEKRHAPKTLKWLFQRKFITHYRKVDTVPPPIF